jgi:large subunit ribosomal protein L29
MKAKDLKDRTVDDLSALEKELQGQFFESRLKNFTNRLDDTSLIRKTKRDIARVKTVLAQKSNAKAGS